MLIKIKENQLNVNGGKTYNLENGDKLILFESPNHPRKNLDSIPNFKNFNDYTNYFKHDSFIHVDNFNRKIRFVRDWPGNIPAFYYHSKLVNELIISDDINVLAKSVKNL